ncbi:MAG: hypothetical protein AAFS10_14745, partial [Myxococcota bacterium]
HVWRCPIEYVPYGVDPISPPSAALGKGLAWSFTSRGVEARCSDPAMDRATDHRFGWFIIARI